MVSMMKIVNKISFKKKRGSKRSKFDDDSMNRSRRPSLKLMKEKKSTSTLSLSKDEEEYVPPAKPAKQENIVKNKVESENNKDKTIDKSKPSTSKPKVKRVRFGKAKTCETVVACIMNKEDLCESSEGKGTIWYSEEEMLSAARSSVQLAKWIPDNFHDSNDFDVCYQYAAGEVEGETTENLEAKKLDQDGEVGVEAGWVEPLWISNMGHCGRGLEEYTMPQMAKLMKHLKQTAYEIMHEQARFPIEFFMARELRENSAASTEWALKKAARDQYEAREAYLERVGHDDQDKAVRQGESETDEDTEDDTSEEDTSDSNSSGKPGRRWKKDHSKNDQEVEIDSA